MKIKIQLLLLLCATTAMGQEKKNILPAEVQIKTAVMAAPPELRDESAVLGYNPEGQIVELRKGSNGFICIAPDYKNPAYYASYCYPLSLEPLMKRGRELIAEGKASQRNKIREEEYKAGKLKMPKDPATMYAYWGTLEKLDHETGEMSDGKRRYVIYIPNAKASDLGLSNQPNNLGIPWLMDEGTYKAHIMITPPLDHKH